MEKVKFNYEEYKKGGYRLETEDGRKARIVCDDLEGKLPLCVARQEWHSEQEMPKAYTLDGHLYSDGTSPVDLVMIRYE